MPNDFESAAGTATPTTFIPDEAEVLLQKLGATHETWAMGAARFGPGGTFDALRKSTLAVRAMQARDAAADKGEKITEAKLDEISHADAEYRQWLDESTLRRAQWLTLDAQRDEWNTRLRFLTYSPVR
jgi:hypothetical protein